MGQTDWPPRIHLIPLLIFAVAFLGIAASGWRVYGPGKVRRRQAAGLRRRSYPAMHIRKPVDFQQFAEAVRALDLYWPVLNEPVPLK